MTKEEAVKKLQGQIDRIRILRITQRFGASFTEWQNDTEVVTRKVFGTKQGHLEKLKAVNYTVTLSSGLDPLHEESLAQRTYLEGLEHVESLLTSFVKEVQDYFPKIIPLYDIEPLATITFRWLFAHTSYKLWVKAASVLFIAFLLGMAAAQTTFFRELIANFRSPAISQEKSETTLKKSISKPDGSNTTESSSKETLMKKDSPPPIANIEQKTKGDQSPAIVSGGDVHIEIGSKKSKD